MNRWFLIKKAGNILQQIGRKLSCIGQTSEVWIDVGARGGQGTLEAAAANPMLTVYAFEPDIQAGRDLTGLIPNYVVLPLAVAEVDGSLPFYLNSNRATCSVLSLNQEGLLSWKGVSELRTETVINIPSIRLDTFLIGMSINKVAYLKIDTQGYDLSVLRSAGEILHRIKKITLEVATHDTPLYNGACTKADIMHFMSKHNYNLVDTRKKTFGQEENLTFTRNVN